MTHRSGRAGQVAVEWFQTGAEVAGLTTYVVLVAPGRRAGPVAGIGRGTGPGGHRGHAAVRAPLVVRAAGHGRQPPSDGPGRWLQAVGSSLLSIPRRVAMKVEVVAIGTELLLGQIVDTNSSWIGEQLALAGLDSHYQTKVGDNPARIEEVLRLALSRSDAVICCGGLGPTQDDLTRDVIATVMGGRSGQGRGHRRPDRADVRQPGSNHAPEQTTARPWSRWARRRWPSSRAPAPGLVCPGWRQGHLRRARGSLRE